MSLAFDENGRPFIILHVTAIIVKAHPSKEIINNLIINRWQGSAARR
jgi:hypothetical protein